MITADEILLGAPGNRQVEQIEANVLRKNKQPYPILVYHDNDDLEWNSNQIAVCYYQHAWCKLGYDHKGSQPLVGQELHYIHQYDLVPSTRHHSDAEESNEGKGKGRDPGDESDIEEPSLINLLIRQSQTNTPGASRSSSPLQRSFTPVNPRVFKATFPTQTSPTSKMATTTTQTQTSQPTQTSAPSTTGGT